LEVVFVELGAGVLALAVVASAGVVLLELVGTVDVGVGVVLLEATALVSTASSSDNP
jgi:hypothetical protein